LANFPPLKAANVGRLFTFASFLDSGNFSASTITNFTPSVSLANFLNFGFIIRQLPHQEAEYCTITVSLSLITSCSVSLSNSSNILLFFLKNSKKAVSNALRAELIQDRKSTRL